MPARTTRARLAKTLAATTVALGAVTTVTVGVGPAEAAVTPTKPLLGAFLGNPGTNPDSNFRTRTTKTPEMAVSYYTGQETNEDYELARVRAGTVIIWDLDDKKTHGQLIAGVANRTSAGLAFIRQYLASAARVDAAGAAAGNGGKVMISGWHEWTIKVNKGTYAGTIAKPATYAKALDVLISERDRLAPGVEIGFVDGFHAGGIANDRLALAAMTKKLDWMGIDRYVTANGPYRSPAETWGPAVEFIRAQPSTSSLPIWNMETGVDTGKGQANIAAWMRSMREDMVKLGISGTSWFNRNSGPAGNYQVLTGGYPTAESAFKAEVNEGY